MDSLRRLGLDRCLLLLALLAVACGGQDAANEGSAAGPAGAAGAAGTTAVGGASGQAGAGAAGASGGGAASGQAGAGGMGEAGGAGAAAGGAGAAAGAAGIGGNGGNGGAPTDTIPAASRIINVGNATELTAALSGDFSGLGTVPANASGPLQPGDHLALAPATYPGNFTLSRSGTETAPIFLRHKSLAGDGGAVVFTGKLNLSGAWTGVHRLKFTGSGTKVDPSREGVRVTRCLFQGNDVGTAGVVFHAGNGLTSVRVDHNEFRDIVGAAVRFNISQAEQNQHIRIERNYIKGHSRGGDNESVVLMLTDAYDDADLHIEYNLFDDCMKNLTNQRELVSVKTAGVHIIGNTLISSNGGYISLRETSDSIVESNWFEDGSHILTYGDRHEIRNNRSTGKVVEVRAGDGFFTNPNGTPVCPSQCSSAAKCGKAPLYWDGSQCRTIHAAARDALVEYNYGAITVGGHYTGDDDACEDAILRHNNQTATKISGYHVGTLESDVNPSMTSNDAVKLTPSEVGIDAGL